MHHVESAEFTCMCMIYDDEGNILVQDRKNPDWPGITFPGGHVEKAESFTQAVIREIKEETGLAIEHPILCGIKQFQTNSDARYVVLFFKTNRYSGTLASSEEGEVFWIPRATLGDYPLAHEFEDMLRIFEQDSLSEFYYQKCDNGQWKKYIF